MKTEKAYLKPFGLWILMDIMQVGYKNVVVCLINAPI